MICLVLGCLSVFSQKSDTLVGNGLYEALYSYKYGQPLYVKYKLYKGGGICNRKKEVTDFRNDSVIKYLTASYTDYEGTAYNRCLFANAEDFAYDCKKQELTFRYYNCSPKLENLKNIWKLNEDKIRKISQTDSLLIFCGNIFSSKSKYVKHNSVLRVPDYFYKLVVSLSTHKVLYCGIFSNTENPEEKELSFKEIEYKTRFYFERITRFSFKE